MYLAGENRTAEKHPSVFGGQGLGLENEGVVGGGWGWEPREGGTRGIASQMSHGSHCLKQCSRYLPSALLSTLLRGELGFLNHSPTWGPLTHGHLLPLCCLPTLEVALAGLGRGPVALCP